jgi:hypothetical protein
MDQEPGPAMEKGKGPAVDNGQATDPMPPTGRIVGEQQPESDRGWICVQTRQIDRYLQPDLTSLGTPAAVGDWRYREPKVPQFRRH